MYNAYNDSKGNNHDFIKNGLNNANHILGHEAFKEEAWTVKGAWDKQGGAHVQYFVATADTTVGKQDFTAGDKILAVKSVKYDSEDREALYDAADVEETAAWTNSNGNYGMPTTCRDSGITELTFSIRHIRGTKQDLTRREWNTRRAIANLDEAGCPHGIRVCEESIRSRHLTKTIVKDGMSHWPMKA